MNRYLSHGAEWKHHKYIRKEGDKYIYADTKTGGSPNSSSFKVREKTINGQGKPVYRRESIGVREKALDETRKMLDSSVDLKYYAKALGNIKYGEDLSKSYDGLNLIIDLKSAGFINQEAYDALYNTRSANKSFFDDLMVPYINIVRENAQPAVSHSGILGQKWGHRNGPPYPLGQDQKTKEEKRLERADKRFVKKNDKKIRRYAEKATKSQMREADKTLRTLYKTKTTRGKVARNYATAYNKILADLMNTAIGDIETPSGRVVKFVAKRGEIGVYTALADRGYDLSQLKNGIYDSGKVAYRKEEVSKMNIDD